MDNLNRDEKVEKNEEVYVEKSVLEIQQEFNNEELNIKEFKQQEDFNSWAVEEGQDLPFEENKVGLIERLKNKKGAWASLAGALGVLLKFKSLIVLVLTKFKFLLVLAKLSKFGSTIISMLLMVWVYAKMYGWTFGAGFVGLLFAHEMGHYLAAQYINLPVSGPVFIPFVGAFVSMKEQPKNATSEAILAIGGPILGSLTALLCFVLYIIAGKEFLLALAYTGFMLNLFNLIPLHPLDGGRVVSVISPKMWLIGIPLGVVAAIRFFNPIMIMLLFLGVVQAYNQWKNPDKSYYEASLAKRLKFASVYFGLLILLGIGMFYIHGLHYTFNF
jgi:Zn-dependent protease